MGQLTRQTVIEASGERVFAFAADPRNAPRYISSIKAVLSGPTGQPEVGQRWQAQANFLGKPAHIILHMSRLERPHIIVFTLIGEPEATLVLRLNPTADKGHTAVSLTLDVPSVPTFLLQGLMGGLLAGDMARLKAIMERPGPA
jgi:hypothetical protein